MDKQRRNMMAAVLLTLCMVTAAPAADDPLMRIRAVGREGAGNSEAAAAWKEISRRGPETIVEVLAAMDGATPAAANWLRAAVDAIAERAVSRGDTLPAARLESFVQETTHAPAARRAAYEWLLKVDPKAPERLLPGFLHDPSVELRRDAVEQFMGKARAALADGKKAEAIAAWKKAFSGATDKDQVDEIVKNLRELGVTVDVADHFGFVRRWRLVSPFENSRGQHLGDVYPPERGVDLTAVYKGKNGAEARWQPHTTADPFGQVDLNKVIGKKKGTIAYGYSVIDSPGERAVEVRVGSINAVKVFLNGKEILTHDEYHHGMAMDQYVGRGALKKGRNELLIKVAQNEQTETWAQNWVFQVRLCDAGGIAVPFTESLADTETKPSPGGVR
jgi:hypothetical protein